ncbi:SGNH/GDSL hydrolase family protein [Flavobacterium sp.]|uniref:SGNH/GDSL hydrolase family protein n=1 Tax=Flavobacterium sp. TaxID=239 RepID=UPI003C33FD39
MQQKTTQDWPYLKKYEKENQSIHSPISEENRVVFMGDSITEFWGRLMPEFFEGKSYINRGISGQTTPQMLVRFRADVIALQPKTVVILAGANDIAGNTGPATLEMITNNLFSMMELAQIHNIKVILCSVLPANMFPWKIRENPSQKIIALNQMLHHYTKENNIQYLDYYSAMVDENDGMITTYTEDGVHPNRKGYEVMAQMFNLYR